MSTMSGPLSTTDRDLLSYTASTLSLIPIHGARELSAALTCIATTQRPGAALLTQTEQSARQVQRSLMIETSPDRWIDDVAGLDEAVRADTVTDLIAQRRQQAEQVSQVIAILARTVVRTPATA